jgi:hypothetical protein
MSAPRTISGSFVICDACRTRMATGHRCAQRAALRSELSAPWACLALMAGITTVAIWLLERERLDLPPAMLVAALVAVAGALAALSAPASLHVLRDAIRSPRTSRCVR